MHSVCELYSFRRAARFGKGEKENQPGGALLLGADGTLYGAVNGDPGYIFAIAR